MAEKILTTLLEILNYAAELLKRNYISEPRLNAELLLADVLRCKRLELYLDFDKPLNKQEKDKFKVNLRRRLNREPMQYIIGNTNFYGYDIVVNESVLIPRQDTEVLVEIAIESIVQTPEEPAKILEVGVGSGCIVIALVSELKKRKIPYNYTGIEISADALKIAKLNADNHKLFDEKFIQSDFLSDDYQIENEYNFIISNPPYVSVMEYSELEPEVREHEPKNAITDFGDGFKFYKKFIDSYLLYKANYFLEIPYNGKDRLETMLNEYGIKNFEFCKDYNNNYRVLKIIK